MALLDERKDWDLQLSLMSVGFHLCLSHSADIVTSTSPFTDFSRISIHLHIANFLAELGNQTFPEKSMKQTKEGLAKVAAL